MTLKREEFGEGFLERVTGPYGRWVEDCIGKRFDFEETLIVAKDGEAKLRSSKCMLAFSTGKDARTTMFTRLWDDGSEMLRKRSLAEPLGKGKFRKTDQELKLSLVGLAYESGMAFQRSLGDSKWEPCTFHRGATFACYRDYRYIPVMLGGELVFSFKQTPDRKGALSKPPTSARIHADGSVELVWTAERARVVSRVLFSADSGMLPVLFEVRNLGVEDSEALANPGKVEPFATTRTEWTQDKDKWKLRSVVVSYRNPSRSQKSDKSLWISGEISFQDNRKAPDSLFSIAPANFPMPEVE